MSDIKNVIIYPRVSTSKQSKNGESLQIQEQECREFCKRNNYQVLGVFSEQFTGTKDKRPKIDEAITFIKNSELEISYIIVLKIDRVSRGGIEIHNSFKKQFSDLGVILKDVHGIIGEDENVVKIDGLNTDKYNWTKNNNKQIAENMTVMMSENERNTILQRMLGQAMRNNKKGFKVRNSDYGFKNEKIITDFGRKTIQIEEPKESIYIKKMFELKSRGDLSDTKIVEEINIMGFRSRERIKWNSNKTEIIGKIGGNKLSNEQFQRYIKSTIYAGIICEEWTGNKALKTPYNGLVSIDLWNKANRGKYKINIISDIEINIEYYKGETKLNEAPIIQKPKNYNPEYPYGKSLKCPECSGHLTAEKSKSKSGKYHHYYSCRGKRGIKHKNYSLRRDEINDEIVNIFSSLNFNNESIELFNFIADKVYEERKDKNSEKNDYILNNIKELETKKNFITSNISKVIAYPDLLEAQNIELQSIKKEITILKNKQKEKGEQLGLTRFKQCSQKILTHLDILVQQRENPEIIQLAFDIVFGGKVNYEDLKSHTPLAENILALNTQKKAGQECNLNQPYALNCKWWDIRGSNPGPYP